MDIFYNRLKTLSKYKTLGRLSLIVYSFIIKRTILYLNIVLYFIPFLIIIAQCNLVVNLLYLLSLRVCKQRHGNMASNRSSINLYIFMNKLDFHSYIHYNAIHMTTNQLPSKLFGSLNLGGL